MKFLEKNLEDIIYEADWRSLFDRGLYDVGKKRRQVRIPGAGVADIISVSRPYFHPYEKKLFKGVIKVYELKRCRIDSSSFFQALKYAHGIRSYLEGRGNFNLYNIQIVLVGDSHCPQSGVQFLHPVFWIDTCEVPLKQQSVVGVKAYTYEYRHDGIRFNELTA